MQEANQSSPALVVHGPPQSAPTPLPGTLNNPSDSRPSLVDKLYDSKIESPGASRVIQAIVPDMQPPKPIAISISRVQLAWILAILAITTAFGCGFYYGASTHKQDEAAINQREGALLKQINEQKKLLQDERMAAVTAKVAEFYVNVEGAGPNIEFKYRSIQDIVERSIRERIDKSPTFSPVIPEPLTIKPEPKQEKPRFEFDPPTTKGLPEPK